MVRDEFGTPRLRQRPSPLSLFRRLLDRVQSRQIDARQLELLTPWLDGEPEVPEGSWHKRFSGMTVCGDGDLVGSFLRPSQSPKGTRVP
jgi:hypothetical protein